MDLNNNFYKDKIKTEYRFFCNKPIDLDDNLNIWCKSISAQEEFKQPSVPILYHIFHQRIDPQIKYYLKNEGFGLDGMLVSGWINFNELEKKCIKMLLSMNKLRQQATFRTRKSASSWGIEIKDKMLRIIIIYFKRIDGFKRIKTAKPDESFLNFLDSINGVKNETNPFSRSFSVNFKTKIFQRDNYTCRYCNWKNGLNGKEDRILTLDHIIPVAHGGTSKEENLTTCCLQCNIKKNDNILKLLFERVVKDKQTKQEDKGELSQ